jgi:hypothetical protein
MINATAEAGMNPAWHCKRTTNNQQYEDCKKYMMPLACPAELVLASDKIYRRTVIE